MNAEPTVQLPGQYSTVAPQVDWVFYFLYWTSVVLFVGIIGTACYFVWRYRRVPGVKAEPTGHNTALEVGWTIAPVVLLVLLFHWGFKGYIAMQVPPANAMEIRVGARQWGWDFTYPGGQTSSGDLYVPVNQPVRLVLSSQDVIHSFYVPAFRIKRDAVPGYYGSIWFTATRTTRPDQPLDLFCAEYCGAPVQNESTIRDRAWGHSAMIGRVHVMERAQFDQQMARLLSRPSQFATDEAWGEALYRQLNCNTCHTTTGQPGTGPSWRGLWHRQERMTSGETVLVDENYIRESILQPQAKIVAGYAPTMPRVAVNNLQINAIIAYIRSLEH